MPTFVILATTDVALADTWEHQLPVGQVALRLGAQGFPGTTSPGFAAVVVLDASAEDLLPANLVRCPTIFVGEPRSLPFEQARLSARARVYLSYEESATRLREFLPLVEEVAEKQSMLDLLVEKSVRRPDSFRPALRAVQALADSAELWDFLEAAVENLEARDRLIAEFRRASRHLLHASHAVFFIRERDGFRADRGTSFFSSDDPIVAFFERHPAVIDGAAWEGQNDPAAELALRNQLALWGARLLVPVHDNGRLLGLIALGVRDDGQPYDENDCSRAVQFARLLRQFLAKSGHITRLTLASDQANLGAKYLPSTIIIGPDDVVPRNLPLVVRDLIGQVRRIRKTRRVAPSEVQPFRVSAGIVMETGGVWAFWEEASTEVDDAIARERIRHRELLRELALTLSHELSNSLVSLALLRQTPKNQIPPMQMIEAMRRDVAKLEAINRHCGLMQTLHEASASATDIRELAQSVGAKLGLRVEVGPDPVILSVSKDLVEFALRMLAETLVENRPERGAEEMALQVRSTGEGPELTVLLSLKGKHLELEGILPEPMPNSVPNQGRIGVFLAKEILRLHRGEIHAGPGLEGTEILISLRGMHASENEPVSPWLQPIVLPT